MRLTSSAFKDTEIVPVSYTCEGPNISPPLNFVDIPTETKSLVLLIEDPDAPAKPWVHWLVFNIPPTTNHVEAGQIPTGGTEGIANGGTHGYEGPCPPSGKHTYIFSLYALNSVLPLPSTADRKDVLEAMKERVIETAQLTGVYQLKNS